MVTLLLEGGPDALFEVRTKLAAGQPCLVVEGSGRSADLLGYAVRLARQQQQQPGTGQFSLSQEQRGLLQSRVKQVLHCSGLICVAKTELNCNVLLL